MTPFSWNQKSKRRVINWFNYKSSRSTSARETIEDQNLEKASTSDNPRISTVGGRPQTYSSSTVIASNAAAWSPEVASASAIMTQTQESSRDMSSSVIASAMEEDLETHISTRVKEGTDTAGRFVQMVLKKLPDCIDTTQSKWRCL